MSAAPIFLLAVAYASGVLIADAIAPGRIASIAAGASAALLLAIASRSTRLLAGRRRGVAAAAAMLLLAAALTGLRLASLQAGALARGGRIAADATLTGEILDRPQSDNQIMRFTMGVAGALIDGTMFRVRERVAVSIRPPPHSKLQAGDQLVVDGRLATIRSGPTRRDRDFAAVARHKGIAARLFAHPGGVSVTGGPRNPLVAIARAGQHAVERMAARLPAKERGLLLGVTIGDRATLDPDVEADFRTTGLSHLLAVSGGNLAMFLGAVIALLRLCRAGPRTTVAVTSIATLAFMAVTRFEPSVIRAGAMTAIALIATAAGARRTALHTLGAACLALMIWDPFLIHNGGFQLSALATTGLLALAPRLTAAFGGGKIAAAAAISLGAQLAVGPLAALRFHQASLVALPANLLAVPAVAVPTVLGLVGALLGAAWRPAGRLCATISYPFLRWMEHVASSLARLPGASVKTPSGPGAIIAVGASLMLIVAAVRMRQFRFAPLLVALALIISVTSWSNALAPLPPDGLRIIALQVGYGDALLITVPGGHSILIDGGPDAEALLKRLRAHGVQRVDAIVLTHPHADHVTGLIAALNRYQVGREFDSGVPPGPNTSPRYPGYLRLLEQKRVPRTVVRTGASFTLGEARFDVLGPTTLFEGTDSDPNNDSVVLRLSYRGVCALLSGDVQKEAQDELLQNPALLRCPILKVPHHGSGKVLQEFYEAVGARIALICVGANDYGHPSPKPLAWMRQAGTRAYRTDRNGDVTVTIGGIGRISVLAATSA